MIALILITSIVSVSAQNERVPISSLGWGTEYLYQVLATVAMR